MLWRNKVLREGLTKKMTSEKKKNGKIIRKKAMMISEEKSFQEMRTANGNLKLI